MEMSDGMRSTTICQKPLILSCLVLSCLVLSCLSSCLVLSCLSVFFLCLCLRGLVVCVSLCVVCGVLLCVWCDDHPCVDSKRLHVYIRNVSVYAGNTRTCFPTCVRGAGIHWDVLNLHTEAFLNLHTGGLRQFSLPKNHARRVLTWPQRGSP